MSWFSHGALRRIAVLTTLTTSWLTVGPSVGSAVANTRAKASQKGHQRVLTPLELARIHGARQEGPPLETGIVNPVDRDVDGQTGSTFAWEGNVGGLNTVNGNKLTTVPIVGWSGRGGMGVSLALYHNSLADGNSEIGQHWTHSYSIYGVVDPETDDFSVRWGDGLGYKFTKNINGSYSAPAGMADKLVADSTGWTLTTKNQVRYRFEGGTGNRKNCLWIKDRSDNQVTIAHDSSDKVTSVTDPTGRVLTFTYSSGKLASVTDPASRTFTFTRNSSDDLTSIGYPLSTSVGYGYDSLHRITSVTDARGKVWTKGYTSSGNALAWEKNPLNHQTNYAYGSGYATITDPLGRVTTHNYGAGGELVSVVAPGSRTTSFGYTNYRRTSTTSPSGITGYLTYDSVGNVLTSTDGLGNVTSYTYNAKNDVVTATSPMGKVVTNAYDTAGRLTSSSAGGATTSLSVNSFGLVTAKTDSNSKTTSYSYNSNGDMSGMTTPGGKVTSWTYNTLGLKTGQTDNLSRTTTITYDNLARITAKSGSGFSYSYSYDSGGNLTSFTDGTGTTSRSYNDAGQLTSETKSGNTVSYAYNAAGAPTSVTDPTGRVQAYTYSTSGDLASVAVNGTTQASYTYDSDGKETGISYANGVSVSKSYDGTGHLTDIVNSNSGGTLSSFSYAYDDDGKRSGVTEADGSVVAYTYNNQGRLTGETRTGSNSYSISCTLDGEGRRTSQVKNGTTTTFSYDTDDAVTALSGGVSASFSYNGVGEQTSRTVNGATWNLSWNADGQMTGMTGPSSATRSFEYDALERRVTRTADGTTTLFTRTAGENGGAVLVESVGSSVSAAYVYGNGLVGKSGEANLYDGLGSTRQVTGSSGSVASSNLSDAFGNTVASSGSAGAYKFAATSGYRDDGDGGLVHIAARYYDPLVGQFTSRDTYLDQKPYNYCESDPVNALDPDGHKPGLTLGKVTGALMSWGVGALIGIGVAVVIASGVAIPLIGLIGIGIVTGIISGGIGGAAQAGIDGDDVKETVIEKMVIGGITGGLGGTGLGLSVPSIVRSVLK